LSTHSDADADNNSVDCLWLDDDDDDYYLPSGAAMRCVAWLGGAATMDVRSCVVR